MPREHSDPLEHLRGFAAREGFMLGEAPPADVLAQLPVIE